MAERSVKTAADGSASISDAAVSGIIGTPIEPVSARISALTLAHVWGRDFAAGMAFGKLVFGAGRFPEDERTYLAGAGWSFTMLRAWDYSYRLMFSTPSGDSVIFNADTGEWHSAALGDFSFGAATTVSIADVEPLQSALFYSGFRAIRAGVDLSGWFLNLPAGLSVSAEAAAEGALSVGFVFSGTPQTERTEEIEAEVPAAALNFGDEVPAALNINAKWAIAGYPVSAAVGDATVAGTVGKEIAPVPIEISVSGDEFRQMTRTARRGF